METLAFNISYVALWLLVVFQTLVLMALLHATYRRESAAQPSASAAVSVAPPGPAAGQRAPAFRTIDAITGAPVTNEHFAGKLTALLFVSPHCASCMTTLDELNALRHKVHGNVALVCGGDQAECARVVGRYEGLTLPTLVDADNAIRNAFQVPGTPYAVLVNEVGTIEFTGQPMRQNEIEALLEHGQPVTGPHAA